MAIFWDVEISMSRRAVCRLFPDAYPKGYSMVETAQDPSDADSTLGNSVISPKKVTCRGSLTPKVLTEPSPKMSGRPN
jgi:hypothetical protein